VARTCPLLAMLALAGSAACASNPPPALTAPPQQLADAPAKPAPVRLVSQAPVYPQKPLYVVDGVVQESPPTSIPYGKVANVQVLKGIVAEVLYGSRGMAGVIVVTTRPGKAAN
jgi:hypothetical protein